MADMTAVGANWVSLTPFSWMSGLSDPDLRFSASRRWWGESDEGIVDSARWAHAAGMKVMLKPHIWVRGPNGWSGYVAMASDADWARWFLNYKRWILHCADLAESERMEALVVGTELAGASLNPANEPEWRRMIAAVRGHFSGIVLWSANWDREFAGLPFWDALDLMGVACYDPVSDKPDPTEADLHTGWRAIAARLREASEGWHRRVVLTEVGYRSSADAAREPWVWRSSAEPDTDLQAHLFEAMFDACWDEPWLGGVFIWKWHAQPSRADRDGRDFTPQGKPALDVIRRHFLAD
jgi:hypothetical protein